MKSNAGSDRAVAMGGVEMNKPTIEQCVEWFYRATIKQPRDTAAALAAEFNYTESDIEAGITEARSVLDKVGPLLDAGLIEMRIVPGGRIGFKPTDKK